MNFKQKLSIWADLVNMELDKLVGRDDCPQASIYKAMRYSLMAGGKRLRPVLMLAVNELYSGKEENVLAFGCAIEMIHTYSLIHDDLPSMDNDDYRRGRLTNHKVFGEALAILAGDALLNLAYEVMTEDIINTADYNLSRAKSRAMGIIASAAGVSGMIGGQVIDLESENRQISSDLLKYMHQCKTGALIKAPILASAVINNASDADLRSLELYAEKIGLAFQVKDDILDVEGNSQVMGKPAGSDNSNSKSTFVTLHGIEASKRILEELIKEASESIDRFGEKSNFLKELAIYIEKREN